MAQTNEQPNTEPASDLTRVEKFLIEEYKSAVQLTYHIDTLRNQLTGFFLTSVGIAATGLFIVLRGEGKPEPGGTARPEVAILLTFAWMIGLCVVGILARLRAVQIEHFGIANNIRTHFLRSDYALWNVVELSGRTLPKPNRCSGTYFWLAIIIVITSAMIGTSTYLFVSEALGLSRGPSLLAALVVGLANVVLSDKLYFRLAQPPSPRTYSPDTPPTPESG